MGNKYDGNKQFMRMMGSLVHNVVKKGSRKIDGDLLREMTRLYVSAEDCPEAEKAEMMKRAEEVISRGGNN